MATGKQRFLSCGCCHTFSHTTSTLMENSHYSQSVWADFIRGTLYGETLDCVAQKNNFSPRLLLTCVITCLWLYRICWKKHPVWPSGIAEFDETFVPDYYNGGPVQAKAGRKASRHGAKAVKRGILNEYVAICTGIQRDGGVIAAAVNCAKPSSEELKEIFHRHIAENTPVLTDGLCSYHAPRHSADVLWLMPATKRERDCLTSIR